MYPFVTVMDAKEGKVAWVKCFEAGVEENVPCVCGIVEDEG